MGAWFCIVCDATGQSERFDRDAEKHTKATGHGTTTSHVRRLVQTRYARSFVYVLSNAAGVVYVGMTWNPVSRFVKHGRKSWWSAVTHLRIIELDTGTNEAAEDLARRIERRAIQSLRPSENVAGVS